MRTSFPSHSKRNVPTRRRVLLVASALCIVALLFHRPLGAWGSYLTTPFFALKVWMNTSTDPVSSFFRTRSHLQSQIDTLEASLADALYDKTRLSVLEEENATLRGSAGDDEPIIADVVVTPNETPYDTLIINKGSESGVQKGAYVYSGKVAIGEVVQTFPKSAFVVLFSTPGIESPVYVYGRARAFARAVGEGGGVLRVGVPQGVPLAVGDPVVVPVSTTAIYGTIAHVESNPSNPEQYGYVTQNAALSSLRTVGVSRNVLPALSLEEAQHIVEEFSAGTTSAEVLIEILPIATSSATSASSTESEN